MTKLGELSLPYLVVTAVAVVIEVTVLVTVGKRSVILGNFGKVVVVALSCCDWLLNNNMRESKSALLLALLVEVPLPGLGSITALLLHL